MIQLIQRSARSSALRWARKESAPRGPSNRRAGLAAASAGVLVSVIAGAVLGGEETVDPRRSWPQWRGPQRTGVAPHADPPVEWSKEKNIRWKLQLPGSGTGSPIVWGGLVFIQAAVASGTDSSAGTPGEKTASPPGGESAEKPRREGRGRGGREGPRERHRFVLLAIDRARGEVRWTALAREEVPHEGHHGDHGYASYSPVTDGERIFASFGSRGLHAFDLQGKRLWELDLGDMRTRNGFGEGTSPALHGETLVLNWDHEGEDFIVALDKRTGKERWRKPREEPTSWTTPLVIETPGGVQVVVAGKNRSRSYALATGDLLWECGGQTENVIPTPVAGFEKVYLTSGFRGSALQAVLLDRKGDLSGSDAIVWSHDRATPYVPSPLLDGERLYFLSGNRALLSCHDARTGKPLFETFRLEGLTGVYASPVAAAGRVYIVGRNGTAVVLGSETPPRVLATNVLDDPIDASPALVDGEIYLRSHRFLYCIARGAGSGKAAPASKQQSPGAGGAGGDL